MVKIQIKYENESDKEKLIQGLLKEFNIIKISKPYRNGRCHRVYVEINVK